METDDYPSEESASSDGDIIFDDSFDDNISKPVNPANRKNTLSRLKELKKTDSRYHLSEYRIKKNDNLWTIARKHGVSVKLLAEINNINNSDKLKVNETISIPSKKGIYYKIRKGDTLSEIAARYNAEIDIIAEHNNIDSKRIIAGKRIFIPDGYNTQLKNNDYKNDEKIQTEKRSIASNTKINKSERTNIALTSKGTSGKLILSWPLRGPITSGFGIRKHPFSGQKKFHCGLDIGAEEGTIVRAAYEGKVIFCGWKEAYGNMLVIAHKNNYITIYAHNSKNLVALNENIKKGQKIALSGKTGAVTGAHLHFEIRKGIVPLNPLRILKK